MRTEPTCRLIWLVALVLLVACEPDSGKLPSEPGITAHLDRDARSSPDALSCHFAEWSAPVPLAELRVSNAIGEEDGMLAPDNLTVVYQLVNADFTGDIYIAHRSSENSPFGTPVNIGSSVNTDADEDFPFLTPDGHTLFFKRDLGTGNGPDIYMAHRRNVNDDQGWKKVVKLGPQVNTDLLWEASPQYAEGAQCRGVGIGDPDKCLFFKRIDDTDQLFGTSYVIALNDDLSTEGQAVVVGDRDNKIYGVPFPTNVGSLSVRRDGLEAYIPLWKEGGDPATSQLVVSRPYGLGGGDVYRLTRAEPTEPWGSLVLVRSGISTDTDEDGPVLSFDGRILLYAHATYENPEHLIGQYVSTRTGGCTSEHGRDSH
jgi:hypothetical protein